MTLTLTMSRPDGGSDLGLSTAAPLSSSSWLGRYISEGRVTESPSMKIRFMSSGLHRAVVKVTSPSHRVGNAPSQRPRHDLGEP